MATPAFLLDSTVHAWLQRALGANQQQKCKNLARDVFFYLKLLNGCQNMDRRRLGRAYSWGFWIPCLAAYLAAERSFRDAGLWTDKTNFSWGPSVGGRSSMNTWSRPPGLSSQEAIPITAVNLCILRPVSEFSLTRDAIGEEALAFDVEKAISLGGQKC